MSQLPPLPGLHDFVDLVKKIGKQDNPVSVEQYYDLRRYLDHTSITSPGKKYILDHLGRHLLAGPLPSVGSNNFLSLLEIKTEEGKYGPFDLDTAMETEARLLFFSTSNAHLKWDDFRFPWPGDRFEHLELIEQWIGEFQEHYGNPVWRIYGDLRAKEEDSSSIDYELLHEYDLSEFRKYIWGRTADGGFA